jgi:hypothetical protein
MANGSWIPWSVTQVVGIGIAWSLAATRKAASSGDSFTRYQVLVVGLVLAASVVGAGEFISGARPKEGLHFVYAAIAITALPLARSFVPATDRRAGIATLAALVAIGFVLYRLFATG